MTEPPLLLSIGSIHVRRATPCDSRALGTLRAAQRAELRGGDAGELERFASTCRAFFERELAAERPWLHAWLALDAERVVGCAALTVVPTLPRMDGRGNEDGRVRDVFVVPEYRRRGIARALVRLVIEEAERLNIDRLALGASAMGRSLYKALGFIAKSDEMLYAPG